MSSARVFSVLAELRHNRTPRVPTERVVNNNSSFTRDFSTISSVRRNIFGPVDHEECRNFVTRELEELATQASDYWGFDFVTEVPISGHARFKWEPTPEKPLCRPRKRPMQIEYDISHLYPEPLSDVRHTEEDIDLNREKKEASEDLAKIAKVRARGQSLITGKILIQILPNYCIASSKTCCIITKTYIKRYKIIVFPMLYFQYSISLILSNCSPLYLGYTSCLILNTNKNKTAN